MYKYIQTNEGGVIESIPIYSLPFEESPTNMHLLEDESILPVPLSELPGWTTCDGKVFTPPSPKTEAEILQEEILKIRSDLWNIMIAERDEAQFADFLGRTTVRPLSVGPDKKQELLSRLNELEGQILKSESR